MILAIIIAVLAYRKASENGRNGVLWGFIGVVVFIGTQFAVSLGFGIMLGLAIGVFGWPESVLGDYEIGITIFAIAASFFTSWLLLKWLGKTPENDTFTPPPEPPTFNRGM